MQTWGALYASGVLSYSRFDNDVRRTMVGVGPSETATGRFASDLLGARLEVGRSYSLPWLNVTPFAAVQTATLWQRDFTETSTFNGLPGILGLTYQSRTTTSLLTFLGVQFDTRLALANSMVWWPFVRAAWVHEFRPDRSIAATFESVPGALFAVDGARAWSDALKVNAGSRLSINQYASCSPASTASLPTAAVATRDVAGSDSAGERSRRSVRAPDGLFRQAPSECLMTRLQG